MVQRPYRPRPLAPTSLNKVASSTPKRTAPNGTDVTGYLGTFLIVELAQAIDELHKMKDTQQRFKVPPNDFPRRRPPPKRPLPRQQRIRLWETKKQNAS